MNNNNDERLIDTIYAAATSHEARRAMVENFKTRFNAEAAGLFAVTGHDNAVLFIDVQGLDGHQDLDLPSSHVETDCSRKGALKSRGIHHSLTATLEKNDQHSIRFFLYRGKDAGTFRPEEIDDFRNLARHLARSVSLMKDFTALRAERESLARILEDMTVGLAFIDHEGRITETNRMAERLLKTGDGLVQRAARLHATEHADDQRLNRALADSIAVHFGADIRCSGPVAIHRARGRRPLAVTAIPLPREPSLASTHAAAVLINDPDAGAPPSDDALHDLYDFTPAETRLARHLSRGTSLREAAKLCGISYETARWRLKIMFQKTDTRRQTELIRLLLSTPPPES